VFVSVSVTWHSSLSSNATATTAVTEYSVAGAERGSADQHDCSGCLYSSVSLYGDAGIVHTGVNFIEKSESSATVRFVRVTYVRHATCSNDNDVLGSRIDVVGSRMASAPAAGFSYKTFVPAPVTVGMCSGTPNYENCLTRCIGT